jgi:hypothetical protein
MRLYPGRVSVLEPRQPPNNGEAKDLGARVLLPHAPPLAVNPLIGTNEGLGPARTSRTQALGGLALQHIIEGLAG